MEAAAYELLRILTLREYYRMKSDRDNYRRMLAEKYDPKLSSLIESIDSALSSLDKVYIRIYGVSCDPSQS